MLTDQACRLAKPAEKPVKLFDEKGLHLLVSPTGHKSWHLKYRFGGKEKQLFFGPYPDVTLRQARDKRDNARQLLREGQDPGVEAKRAKLRRTQGVDAIRTFRAAAVRWHELQKAGWKPFGLAAAEALKAKLSHRTRAYLGRGDSPRSGEKVWRNSYTEGTIEDRVWKPIHDGTARGGKRWTAALLKAAKAFEYKTRLQRREAEPGARNGKLGEVGLEVLEWLYDKVDFATGRLEPAIATVAEGIGRSYSAVHEALCRLRTEGFLHWMRRSKPIEDPEPGGPQVEQVPNAYALLVPREMKDWLRALFHKGPAPACDEDRRKREREAYEAMLKGMTTLERHDATWNGDRLLGETLRNLATALDGRSIQRGESGRGGETGGSY